MYAGAHIRRLFWVPASSPSNSARANTCMHQVALKLYHISLMIKSYDLTLKFLGLRHCILGFWAVFKHCIHNVSGILC